MRVKEHETSRQFWADRYRNRFHFVSRTQLSSHLSQTRCRIGYRLFNSKKSAVPVVGRAGSKGLNKSLSENAELVLGGELLHPDLLFAAASCDHGAAPIAAEFRDRSARFFVSCFGHHYRQAGEARVIDKEHVLGVNRPAPQVILID